MDNFEFLESIANGYSPITGEKFADGDILLNPEVALRLFKLVRELKTEEEILKVNLKNTFVYTPDINEGIIIKDRIKSSEFAANIKNAIKLVKNVEVLNTRAIHIKINKFLSKQGILEPVSLNRFLVSDMGEEKGFYTEIEPEKSEIDRTKVFLTIDAQQYILSNLEEILNNY